MRKLSKSNIFLVLYVCILTFALLFAKFNMLSNNRSTLITLCFYYEIIVWVTTLIVMFINGNALTRYLKKKHLEKWRSMVNRNIGGASPTYIKFILSKEHFNDTKVAELKINFLFSFCNMQAILIILCLVLYIISK